jgi:hypothetical protein
MQTYSHNYDPVQGFCGDAQGDGTGVLVIQVQDSSHPAWRFVSPSGGEMGSFGMWAGELYQEPDRYTGFIYNAADWYLVQAVDEHGSRGGGSTVFTGSQLPVRWPDPNGGLFAAGPTSTSGAQPRTQQAWMFEPDGRTRWGPRPLGTAGPVYGVGVDFLGRALAIVEGGDGTINAIWFERDGTAMTPFFAIATGFAAGAATWFEALPLIGGGLAVRRLDAPGSGIWRGWHSTWLAVIPSGSSAVQAPPDWLTSRPDTSLQVIHGNRAYALLPLRADNTVCEQKLEVLAPNGTSCGSMSFPVKSGTCNTWDLRVGIDGTVLQRFPAELEVSPTPRSRSCTLRFWPAAVR